MKALSRGMSILFVVFCTLIFESAGSSEIDLSDDETKTEPAGSHAMKSMKSALPDSFRALDSSIVQDAQGIGTPTKPKARTTAMFLDVHLLHHVWEARKKIKSMAKCITSKCSRRRRRRFRYDAGPAAKSLWCTAKNENCKWRLGDKGHGHFVINSLSMLEPQFLLRSDSLVFHGGIVWPRANPSWQHHLSDVNTKKNIKLGNWIMGAKDHDHFVISDTDTTICQFLIRNDGHMFWGPKAGEAPHNWRHTAKSSTVLELGEWLVGPKDSNHFVISHKPSGRCTFLIRSDGHVFYNSDHRGRAPSSFAL